MNGFRSVEPYLMAHQNLSAEGSFAQKYFVNENNKKLLS